MYKTLQIFEDKKIKSVVSENYHYFFDKQNGNFVRWGKNKNDDPLVAPAPEIADIEISTICHGVSGIGPCKFCYKTNTPVGKNMSLQTFKKLFSIMPPTLTQIAFGIGDIDGNPDMFNIFKYTRKNGIIPNVTINGDRLNDDYAKKFAKLCGAVAVSYYDKDITYNAVKKLTDLGMKQVNIHFMLSEERFELAKQLLLDIKEDSRLSKLNAVVFLGLKNKGRAKTNKYTILNKEKFKNLIDYAFNNHIGIGFDSCSAGKFIQAISEYKEYKNFLPLVEPCESLRMSMYIDVNGKAYPCSFSTDTENWNEGIDLLKENINFQKEFWFSSKVNQFRKKCIACNKNNMTCPVGYNI